MSKVFLIGDTHFNHKGISHKFRQHFSTDLEHDETIHNNILSVRGSSHQLYLLGDIFFHPDGFSKLKDYAKAFQNVHIVLGNHDHQHVFLYATKFKNVKVAGLLNKYGCWLSHAPIHPQELYRGLSVHGHCHSKVVPDDRYICVSAEQTEYTPRSLESIQDEFRTRGVMK